MRKMILATTKEEREKALKELLPMQREDFEKIFRTMSGKKVTVRYLDPPLHEFLPKTEEEVSKLAQALKVTEQDLYEVIESLKEFNPMMGHRGCRLAITYPEIAIMQTRAIIEAAITVTKQGHKVLPELMIPLIGDVKELEYLKEIITNEAEAVMKEKHKNIDYELGTMIEVPRSTIQADKIAKEVEFFSFGTNDLTQMTYGFFKR